MRIPDSIVIAFCFAFVLTAWSTSTRAADTSTVPGVPAPILLWPSGAPGATGTSDEDKPAIYPFLPEKSVVTGGSILLIPGGAFTTRCEDNEGIEVAKWLNRHGIAAFMLRYRIRPLYQNNASIDDAHRAMQYIRAHAEDFQIAPDHIGMMGFSAGAELICLATYRPVAGDPAAVDPLDRIGTKANYLVLVYGSSPLPGAGGRGGGFGARGGAPGGPAPAAPGAVTPPAAAGGAPATLPAPPLARGGRGGGQAAVDVSSIPPTFMFCTVEDTSHVTGMLSLFTTLRQGGVPVECHFFTDGEHGTGIGLGDPVLGEWPNLMYNWIRNRGYLTNLPRVAVHGIVKIDGQTIPRGLVVFTPIDLVGAPPIVARDFNTTANDPLGLFHLSADKGPTPGKYHVTIFQDATRWLSNARDPMTVSMSGRRGGLTEAEQKQWDDYVRNRDLSPSIEDQRIYSKAHPTDKDDMIVEIKPGMDNEINIDVFSK